MNPTLVSNLWAGGDRREERRGREGGGGERGEKWKGGRGGGEERGGGEQKRSEGGKGRREVGESEGGKGRREAVESEGGKGEEEGQSGHSLTHPPGQLIDGPQNGPAPGPWDIAAQPSQLFQNSQKHFEVPHTASVKVCHGCMGNGFNRCWKCLGRGRVSHVISGRGRVSHVISGWGQSESCD